MSSVEAGILVGCAAVVNSAHPDLPEPIPEAPSHATVATARPPTELVADLAAKCRAMTADHERMIAEMSAAGRRLEDLVARMNAASRPEKANETAAAVTEMAAQCLAMRNRMVKMELGVVAHLMEHMQAGAGSLLRCPMIGPTVGMKR